MTEVRIIDPKTGRELGKVNDETCVTEISEEWRNKRKSVVTTEEEEPTEDNTEEGNK